MSSKRSPKLSDYRAKRDFKRTSEPAAEGPRKPDSAMPAPRRGSRSPRAPRFVVQEHHARRLHWDLRLEHEGVLLSWALPSGVPQEPSENRLAVHVEDHPLSYLEFEGEIPQGSYGAGRVEIWDRGTYQSEKLEPDKVVVVLHGERVQGRYALFRTRGKDWMIHRMDPPEQPRDAFPEHLQPMLATASELPRDDRGWAFEVKWDGVRAIAYWRPAHLRLESRNLKDVSTRYPELRALGSQLGSHEVVLDGEIVAFDEQGKPSFGTLQRRMHLSAESAIRRLAREAPVTYVIFDLLYLDGHLALELPYRERRGLLDQLQLNGERWQTPAFNEGEGTALLAASAEHGLEGIVAKRLDSRYLPGERSRSWLKIKNTRSQELVIGGWLVGQGRRSEQLGALLVGYYEDGDKRPELRYAGRVGTGFNERELALLRRELDARSQRASPFSKRGVQPPREARYVSPELVAEIEFSSWTRDRILRHSSYKGLREDKPAQEVVREDLLDPAGAKSRAKSRSAKSPRRSRGAEPSSPPYELLSEKGERAEIEVEGRVLRLSNRDKALYPSIGLTKGQIIDFYAAIAPVLLPHLAERPLTLKRYPDGVDRQYFYQKRCPAHRPEWVQTAPVWSGRLKETVDYCLVEDLPTLLWVANLAGIELHTSLSRARDVQVPTTLVFDLDPGAPAGERECARVALHVRELLGTLGLQTFAKTSGSKGLQVYAPLNTPVSYEDTKPFARAVAELLERQHPKTVVSRMTKSLRAGRVLIDWSQNDPHKTTVCVYSLRARERPTISTPLRWEEVERASRRRAEVHLSAEPHELLERIEAHGDLFAQVLSSSQRLPDLSSEALKT